MNRWIRENLSLGVMIPVITALLMGVAYAAVLNSDVQGLKQEVYGIPPEKSIAVRLQRLEDKIDTLQDTIDNFQRKVAQNGGI